MRSILLISTLLSLAAAAHAQPLSRPPVPADPLELVTGPTRIVDNAAQRGDVVALMARTMANHDLHARGTQPWNMQVSFVATASTQYPAGQGQLQETWASGLNWRWTASLGAYSQVQLSSNGSVYSQSPALMPIRLKTLRQALFEPIGGSGSRETVRIAPVTWSGTPLTCVLVSAGTNRQTSAAGRQWYETEYCIDPATDTLRTASWAPGIYVAYDYSQGLKFHGQPVPNGITITEGGATALEATVGSITDADPASSASLFIPTAQMAAQGPAAVAEAFERMPMYPSSPAIAPGAIIQPVIVHATLDAQGNIREEEALQNNAMAGPALAVVKARRFPVRPTPAGASPRLRELFVNVQFVPQAPDIPGNR